MMEEELNLSFAGCGFLGVYYAGVSVCFQRYAPHLKFKCASGASAGAIAACGLICNIRAEDSVNDLLDLILNARRQILGPFSPSFNLHKILKEKLNAVLPQNAHLLAKGRLRVSLTRVRDGQNVVVSDFESRDDLIDCLLATSFVPIFSGLIPPKFRGVRYIDGMFTDNLPRLENDTITVSPFCGESDICPENNSTPYFHINVSNTSIAMSVQNVYNFATILWPPKAEILAELCKIGFEDTLRFLQKRNYASCTKCLSIQSTYVISQEDEPSGYDPTCDKCEEARKTIVLANLPELIELIFQGYIKDSNKGLYNWLLSHPGIKVISFLALPYTLPIDFAYAFIIKVKNILPQMAHNLTSMSKFVIQELLGILRKMSHGAGYKLSATLKMEYDLGSESKLGADKRVKIDFRLNDKNVDVTQLKSKILSRRGSSARSTTEDDGEVLSDILDVKSRQESVMAFYYTDENNQIQVTEIYDVSDCPDDYNSDGVREVTNLLEAEKFTTSNEEETVCHTETP